LVNFHGPCASQEVQVMAKPKSPSSTLELNVPTYIPLPEAAQKLGLSEQVLTQLIQAGKIDAVQLPSGELLVPADNGYETKEQILQEKYTDLVGQWITITEAAQKYEIPRSTMEKWIEKKHIQIIDPDRHTKRIMSQMQKDLRLKEAPVHIECFDNSNIQGSNPVAACVVFKNGKPDKKEYRHFNIKTVTGPDDYASMEEVVHRRYKRLLDEERDLPQLIVIDGGKGQLSSALKSLEVLGLRGKIAIIGIAKRLEEIYYPGDPVPLYLDKKSESLKIIQQLRNEAHRFGITHHRNKRSKGAIQTDLSNINGVGEKTILTLLKKFRSIKRLKNATFDELVQLIGRDKAQKVCDHLKIEHPPKATS